MRQAEGITGLFRRRALHPWVEYGERYVWNIVEFTVICNVNVHAGGVEWSYFAG